MRARQNRAVIRCWGALGTAAALLLATQALAATSVSGERFEDPLLRAAQFDLLTDDPFMAITRLQADLAQGRITRRPAQTQLLLGEMYLANGAHYRAASIFQGLAKGAQSQKVRNQTWLTLAQLQHRRGRADAALASLQRIAGDLPAQAEQERLLLAAMLLMQQEQFAQAVPLLRQLGGKVLLKQLGDKALWPSYGRFNLAVALFRLGQDAEGHRLLSELGEAAVGSEQGRALRDKANLTLAYYYLGKNLPDEAQQYFLKTRLQGPLSSRALLGLGRAYAARGLDKKALVPWLQLSKMDVADPAVQDGLLAVPLAFGKLEAFKQALAHYQQALDKYRAEAEQVVAAEAALKEGALLQGIEEKLPNTPGGQYLWQLFATHEFQQGLKNHARLRLSLGRLAQWSSQVEAATDLAPAQRRSLEKRLRDLRAALLSMQERLQVHLILQAQETLQLRKQRLRAYTGEARFSMAQMYEYAAKRWGAGR